MIKIIGPKEPRNKFAINTTSSSTNWSKGLSPFFLGPVLLYTPFKSLNVENAWQFSKVYKKHCDGNGNPTDEYFKWAVNGWNSSYAYRYPMGKGAIPEYCYWDGKKLDYIQARKEVYVPLYSKAVRNTEAFKKLEELYKEKGNLILFDFDGYDHDSLNMSLTDVINCTNKKMGHAFVLKMILEKIL
jgi:hypothetical protein